MRFCLPAEHAVWLTLPDPPEPAAVDLLTDPANVTAALAADDPARYLADLALRSGTQTAGPEALARVLRLGHRDEAARADLVEIADRELRRRERAARYGDPPAQRCIELLSRGRRRLGNCADLQNSP